MKNLDLQVIQQALAWVDQGHCVWLCTVLATFGSAPRGPGSLLVARPTGAFFGSLSGGCVEEDFLERLGRNEFAGDNHVVRYGEGGLAPSLELPCGGILDVLDDLTLLEAVRTPAFYIGAMGSKRTSEKRMERVQRIGGIGQQDLERIHAPIGLKLGSKTPAEIALAVMADIVRVSNGVSRDQL